MIQSLSSGMQAQWYRHEVLANDLANVSTAGFKQDSLILKQGTIEAGPGGTIAAGAHSISQWTDFSQVALHETERPLDVALSGSGFFVVQTPAGPRYTRAGALSVNAQGNLVSAGGFQVLGVGGPISVRSSKIAIGPQGDVQDDGQSVDTLRVVDFPKPYALIKESRGLFVPADVKVAPRSGHGLSGGGRSPRGIQPERGAHHGGDDRHAPEVRDRAAGDTGRRRRRPLCEQRHRQTPVIRALYSSASGMQAQQLNLDAIANNLSNVNTAGFKGTPVTSRISCTRPSAPRAPRAPKARPFPPVSDPRER
jgi:flagellar basal-body rod protein FlgF